MKLTEHLVFLAMLTPTVAVLTAAAISLATPTPSLSISLDAQTLGLADYLGSYSFADQP